MTRPDAGDTPSEPVAVYLRLRRIFSDPAKLSRDARRRFAAALDETSVPYGTGRDPRGIDAILDTLTESRGWESPLARAELLVSWPEIVGAETAAHTTPVGIEDGVLTVRCDSTAWAQQLRNMSGAIAVRVEEQHRAAGIDAVKFIGPDTPSWKRGPRAIPGRGPRDTYG